MLVLSGGTGTVKLVRGMKGMGADFSVAVNTAEDLYVSGNLVCPDLDSVMYGLAGVLGEDLWGFAGDTFYTHERLEEMGSGEYMAIGDRDRATHVRRTELLNDGYDLTEATAEIRRSLGVERPVFPMTHDGVETHVETPDGELHFQEFWVREAGEPEVEGVELRGIEGAEPSPGLRDALEREDIVVVGPSNPVTSIGPIIGLDGVREALEGKRVLAVSPIVGEEPVSGPVAKLMEAEGYEATSRGVEEIYGDVVDIFVTDVRDDFGEHRLDTVMEDESGEARFASDLLELMEGLGWL